MSRWLWALLGGVVLVAIAALFWTAGNQKNVTPPVSPGPTAVAPAPVPPPPALRRSAREPPPRLRPAPALPTAQEAAAPPAPSPTAPPAPALRRPLQDSKPPRRPAPAPLRALDSSRPPKRPCRRPRPDGRRRKSGVYAPKSLAQLVGTWAYSAEDCERLFQRRGGGWAYRQPVDKFAQAAIVESTKKILLPSASCRIEGASEAEGGLRWPDCEDSLAIRPGA